MQNEYVVADRGQVFFVPKYAVEAFLPDFKKGLEDYVETQSKVSVQRQQSAYHVLSKVELNDEVLSEWLSALLVTPLLVFVKGNNIDSVSIPAFTKFYSKAWKFHTQPLEIIWIF